MTRAYNISEKLSQQLQEKIDILSSSYNNKIPNAYKVNLTDKNQISEENALTICDYIIAMMTESNPRLTYIKYIIQFLFELSKSAKDKKFIDFTKKDVLSYLDSCRKDEDKDPMHKWVGTYNIRLIVISKFFKWLQYPKQDAKERNELSASEKKPECIQGIKYLKRKEISCYKNSDLWTPEDDALFLKYVTNPRDRCYHTMARDTSCRPHELLNLKIKDIIHRQKGGHEYYEIMVNGKTGSRTIPLIDSFVYVREWLKNHPSRNNENIFFFVTETNKSHGRDQLVTSGIEHVYYYYKHVFFPKLLKEEPSKVSAEDRIKLQELLKKPWNPYIRRHTALTEKSRKLKAHVLNQHSGWSARSNMAQKYLHYYGNESSNDLLEAYGIVDTKEGVQKNALKPKVCPQCQEVNPIDARFCGKCNMIISLEGYQQAQELEKQKDIEIGELKQRDKTNAEAIAKMQEQLTQLQDSKSHSKEVARDGLQRTMKNILKRDNIIEQLCNRVAQLEAKSPERTDELLRNLRNENIITEGQYTEWQKKVTNKKKLTKTKK